MLTLATLFLSAPFIWAGPIGSERPGRIIGGHPADDGQFPFAAAIYTETVLGNFFCGGTLITERYILTAAQCVHGIRLGTTRIISDDPNSLVVTTGTYYITPGWNILTLENDIGLIRLREPVTLSEYIKPVDHVGTLLIPDNSTAIALGWGQTSDASAGLEDQLSYVNVQTMSNEECRIVYGNQIKDGMICVVGNTNEGTCYGDTGGPLIVYGNNSEVFVVGVASFVSGNGCESSDPSGFVRINDYVNWINQVLTNVG